MPSRDRRHKYSQRQTDPAAQQRKACPHCGSYWSAYKGAWKIHVKCCKSKQLGAEPTECSPIPGSAVIASPTLSEEGEGLGPASDDVEPEQTDWWETQERLYWEREDAIRLGEAPPEPHLPASEDDDSDVVPPLQEDQIWIKRHPASNMPSGFLNISMPKPNHSATRNHFKILPAYFPFRSMGDFRQAEVFSKFGATDKHINSQLRLETTKVSLRDAKEYHETLAHEIRLSGEFISRKVVTEFEGHYYEHFVHFQPVFLMLTNIVADPELAKHMVWYPEERHVHRPGTESASMQVLEELWHSKIWWDMQDSLGPGLCVLYLVLYIDETNVSTIGGVKVWPVYLWVGNLPASIRKRRGAKGGAYLVGYLPKASKASDVTDLATFRCKVYHDALNIMFESLKIPARYGAPMRCGDGVIRTMVPAISAGSIRKKVMSAIDF